MDPAGMGRRCVFGCLGFFMRQSKVIWAALAAVAAVGAASAAQAGTVFDTSLSNPPGVFFGSGNFNTHFAVTTVGGIEIGLKSKIRGDATDSIHPVGDVYTIGLGNKVSFDYAVLPGSVDLTGSSTLLSIRNVLTGQHFSFDPSLVGDNAHSGSAYENSEQLAFFPVGFTTALNATYDVTLTLSNVAGLQGPVSVENWINVGAGGVPEPATWAMMILGVAGIGASLRRTRKTAAAATA
jgi:hypothetical protein